MKKGIFIICLISICSITYAKKVKFSVNMAGNTLSPNGIHMSCDFQVVAGFGGANWDCNIIQLTKETVDTNIYSIVVDIPAWNKYEFKFINGDQCYEVEIVPDPARVGYNFVDNRWIFIDSLANDTTDVGAVLFSGNAPQGKLLARYYVDMTITTPSANYVHVAGSHQAWNPQTETMYSFGGNVYEIINYLPSAGSYEYKFYNGNTVTDAEIVPSTCANVGNRTATITSDTLLPIVCFSKCGSCYPAGINDVNSTFGLQISPNPVTQFCTITIPEKYKNASIKITDIYGKTVRYQAAITQSKYNFERNQLASGVYFIQINTNNETPITEKLILN